MIVPYPPGGATDTTARIIFAKLSENPGRAFYIENRSGASGTLGEAIVAKSESGHAPMSGVPPKADMNVRFERHQPIECAFAAASLLR